MTLNESPNVSYILYYARAYKIRGLPRKNPIKQSRRARLYKLINCTCEIIVFSVLYLCIKSVNDQENFEFKWIWGSNRENYT